MKGGRIDAIVKKAEGDANRGFWYHGTSSFDGFEDELRAGESGIGVPIFFSRSLKFAKMYAGYQKENVVVKAKLNVKKVFEASNQYNNSEFWPPAPFDFTDEGKQLLRYLMVNYYFLDEDYEFFQSLLNEHYDIMESSLMKKYFIDNGYDAFMVTGDGERNIAVLDPKVIEIEDVLYPNRGRVL